MSQTGNYTNPDIAEKLTNQRGQVNLKGSNSTPMIKLHVDLTKVTSSIIANQLALNFNHEIQLTKYYKQNLKQVLKRTNEELLKAELKDYDEMYGQQPEVTSEVYSAMESMVKELAEIGIMNFGSITTMLQAFRKDPKSIEGIVNKINR